MEAFRRTVVDLDRAIDFYCDALGFELDIVGADQITGRRRAVLTLGSETLELIDLDEETTRKNDPRAARSFDLEFQHVAIVAADMPAAFARLKGFWPRAISEGGTVRLPPAAGSVIAFKFRDPEGHPLELIHFPAGTGDARWQRPASGGPTLGIDHSAIVVSDTNRSIAFYEDGLGFSMASHQVNRGSAQDALDGVAGAVVEVVALAPAASPTPHLELLGYRHPAPAKEEGSGERLGAPGRDMADHIVWAVNGVADIVARLASGSSRQPATPRGAFRNGCALVLDPDGHAHVLVERDFEESR